MAAQWLMLTLTSSATYVALVQTAAGLPVVLFAVLAGTIGDLVDRRRFLLITQTLMLIAPDPRDDRPRPPGDRHALAGPQSRERARIALGSRPD